MSKIYLKDNLSFSRRGITLTELIVATMVVGIALLGVVAVDYAIRTQRDSASAHADLNAQLSAVMLQITQVALKITGRKFSSGYDNSGEEYKAEGMFTTQDKCSICFRNDQSNPYSFEDDKWRCFEQKNGNWLWACEKETSELGNNWLPGCPTSDSRNQLIQLSTNCNFFNVMRTSGNIDYIAITLKSKPRIYLPTDPINNPEYTLTSKIYPPGLSQ